MTLTTQMNDILCNLDWKTCYDCVVIRYIHRPVPVKFMALTTKCFVIDLIWMCCCQDKGLAEVKQWWLSSFCILWCWLFLLLWAWFSHCEVCREQSHFSSAVTIRIISVLHNEIVQAKMMSFACFSWKYKSLPWGMLQQYQKLQNYTMINLTLSFVCRKDSRPFGIADQIRQKVLTVRFGFFTPPKF